MTKYGLDDPATDDHAQAGREDTSSIVKSSAHSPSSGLGIPLPTPTSAPFAPGISKKSISGTAVPFRDSPLTEDDESIHSSRNTKRPEVRNGGDNSSSPVPRINVRSPTGFRETEEPTNLLACNGVTTSSGRLESDDEGSAEPNGHDLHIADDERKIPSNGTVPVTHHTLTSRPLGDGERNAEDIVPADPLSHKPVLRAWSYRNGAWYSKAINDIKTSKIIVYAPIDELIEVKHKSYMKGKQDMFFPSRLGTNGVRRQRRGSNPASTSKPRPDRNSERRAPESQRPPWDLGQSEVEDESATMAFRHRDVSVGRRRVRFVHTPTFNSS